MKHMLMVALVLGACGDSSSGTSTPMNQGTHVNTMDMDMGETADMVAQPDLEGDLSQDLPDAEPDLPGDMAVDLVEDMSTQSDPFLIGPLAVRAVEIDQGQNNAPRDVLIVAPSAPGEYPVLAFHHGFILRVGYYEDTLAHLASHGFIVVAPQMATSFVGSSTVEEEADDAQDIYGWMQNSLSVITGVTPDFDRFGVIGHSRGGKVAWTILRRQPQLYQAIAGLEPVDGTGGFAGTQPRVANTPFPVALPTYILGTGLGPTGFQSCSPEGDNYVQFYQSSINATQVVATAYGHMDMLDEDANCGIACLACASGPNDGGLVRMTRGHLTAFFRAALQGRAEDVAVLSDANAAGIQVTVSTK